MLTLEPLPHPAACWHGGCLNPLATFTNSVSRFEGCGERPPFAEEGQIRAHQPRRLRRTWWPQWGQIVVVLFTLQRTGHGRVYSSLLSIHTPKTRQQIAMSGTLTPMHNIMQSPCPSSSFWKCHEVVRWTSSTLDFNGQRVILEGSKWF